jgi:hypothetical protein
MAAFIKHVGTHKGTNTRLSVVFLRLPDEPENALAVYSDSLPDKYHEDFMKAVESKEGQAAKELYEVLSRKVFWNGNNMLETLHKEGLLVKIPVDAIIMTPNSVTSLPLPDLLTQMDEITGGNATRTPEATGQTVQENIADQVDASLEGDNKKIAQNLLIQAVMLEKEAERKRAEAVKFDPSLTEKAEKPAKRGRGRPVGTTAKAMKARAEAAAPADAVPTE